MELVIKDISIESLLEKDIIENVITNDEYVKRFAQIPNWQGLLDISWADTIIKAALAFSKKYKTAPKKKYILEYLDKNQKEFRFRDDVLPTIVAFIEGLNDDKAINPEFEIENAVDYLKRKALKKTHERLGDALEADNFGLAEKALETGKPSTESGMEELDVLDMDDQLQIATSISEEPLITMGGSFGDLVTPHIKTGKFVAFLSTAKGGKTWCIYTLAAAAYNSGTDTLIFACGDMDANDNSIRIGHIMSCGDTASDISHTGVYAYPIIDCLLNQDGSCKLSSNTVPLAEPVEKMMKTYDSPEALLGAIPPGFAPCDKCRHCKLCVPTVAYEPHNVQYKGWMGLNSHKALSKRRNGSVRFKIKICPNKTLTTQEIERQLIAYKELHNWQPKLVVIDYADIMGKEETDSYSEFRHGENERWGNLRKLSNKYPICILTVTQSNRGGYDVTSMGASNVNEDRRKLDHTTAFFSLNQTPLEKRFRIARSACIMARGKSEDSHKEVMLLQAYESGRFCRGSFWRKLKE